MSRYALVYHANSRRKGIAKRPPKKLIRVARLSDPSFPAMTAFMIERFSPLREYTEKNAITAKTYWYFPYTSGSTLRANTTDNNMPATILIICPLTTHELLRKKYPKGVLIFLLLE